MSCDGTNVGYNMEGNSPRPGVSDNAPENDQLGL